MAETRRLRPSSIVGYADCPRRWAARHATDLVTDAGYVLAPNRPLHIGAAVGSGVHAAVGYTLSEKLATGSLGAQSEAEGRAEAEFDARAEHGVVWDATTADKSVAKRQLARMSRAYRRHLAPVVTPLVVEERLEADLGDGWVLSGQADTLAGDPDVGIRDLKTGTQQRANGVQYAAYQLLFGAHGYNATALYEDFLRRVKIDKEQPAPVTSEIDVRSAQADALELIDDIKRSTAEFSARVASGRGRPPHAAFRANPASVLCAAKWCPAHGTDFCKAATHAHA